MGPARFHCATLLPRTGWVKGPIAFRPKFIGTGKNVFSPSLGKTMAKSWRNFFLKCTQPTAANDSSASIFQLTSISEAPWTLFSEFYREVDSPFVRHESRRLEMKCHWTTKCANFDCSRGRKISKRVCPGWGSNSRPSDFSDIVILDYETDALPTALPRQPKIDWFKFLHFFPWQTNLQYVWNWQKMKSPTHQ